MGSFRRFYGSHPLHLLALLGCFALYIVIRRGGEKWVRKKLKGRFFDRAIDLYQKYGLMAVIVPALLPPPSRSG